MPSCQPAPRSPTTTEIHATNKFRVLLSWGFDGGEVVAFGSYTFIVDYDLVDGAPASDPVAYKLRAAGFGGGTPVAASGGDPTRDWNSFTAHRVTTTRGFEGQARYGSAGGGVAVWSFSVHSFLRLVPSATDHEIMIRPFQASAAGGAGALVVQGPFTIDDETTRVWRAMRGP